MKGYTDIHAHFVYGMDDGAQTREEMCAMLDAAEADGIGLLYATPHVVPGVRPFDWETYERRLREARAYCGARGYGMELRAGAEVLYTPALERYAAEQELPELEGTGRVLLEFAPQIAYAEMEAAIAQVERGGYGVVLAHIERYECLYPGKNAWALKERHAVRYQVNCRTVAENNGGFLRRRKLESWIEDGLVDCVASDAHNMGSRPFMMRAAYKALRERFGRMRANELMRAE